MPGKNPLQIKAKIIYNKRVGEDCFSAFLAAPKIARIALPGQFVNIKIGSQDQPLLRRPLGVHRVLASGIEMLYEVVGPATKILSRKRAGEVLDIIGPLGNGFSYEPRAMSQEPIIVAGGMGVAPLTFLAERLRKASGSRLKAPGLVLIGARTKKQIFCEKEFKALGYKVKIATDDGSAGFKGRVTDLLKHLLRAMSYEPRSNVYACGPRPMLKAISAVSKERNIPAQVSLEEHMACGIGACLGCVVNTKNGLRRVCKEGPVFAADEIIWE